MAHKVLLVCSGEADALRIMDIKEKYGDDVIMLTPEEAMKQNLKMEDFVNMPTFKITAPPIIPLSVLECKCGKEERRERRANERKQKKKR